MSIRVMASVWDMANLGPYERLVMLCLADHADDAGKCYPAIKRICERTGMGERGVQNVLRRLEADGLLTIQNGGGRHVRNGYTLTINPAPDAPINDEKPRTENPVSGAETPHPITETPHPVTINPAPDAPEPSRTIKEPSEEPPLVPPPKKPDKARLPPDWALSDEGWAYARSKQIPDEDIEDEARGFHAYWTDRTDSSARKSAFGWEQCWANRVRAIASRYSKGRGMAGPSGSGGRGQGGGIAGAAARRWAGREI